MGGDARFLLDGACARPAGQENCVSAAQRCRNARLAWAGKNRAILSIGSAAIFGLPAVKAAVACCSQAANCAGFGGGVCIKSAGGWLARRNNESYSE